SRYKVMVEIGNIATDWVSAEEDFRHELATYVRNAEEDSTELSRRIETADGKAVEAKTYAQQTADAIKTRLESLEIYKNAEGDRAEQYLTASREETARQLTAERTAIATNYVAKSTYDENVRGTTLKLNDIKTTADTAKQNLATYQNTVDRKLTELISTTQTLDGKINTASVKITQNANEISKRLTSTQVDKAITDKGYQTKSDVDNNITGRGYITNAALQPYALSTTVQNLVQETAGSFERQITETRGLIPTEIGTNNLFILSGNTKGIFKNYLHQDVKNLRYAYGSKILIDSQSTYTLQSWSNILNDFSWLGYSQLDSNGVQIPNTYVSIYPARLQKYYRRDIITHNSAKYIQFSFSDDVFGDTPNLKIKFEKGMIATDWSPAPEDLATVTALHAVNDTVDSHTRTIGAVGETGSILDNISKVTQTAAGLVQEVSGTNGLKTQVSTLAGSYAIKNLTSSGTVLNQLNLNKDGSVKIDGKLVQITGTTYIQDGVITSAKIAGLDAGKINTGELNAARIKANSIDGSKIVFDQAFLNKMTANEALFKQLFAQSAFITSVQAVAVSAKQIAGGIAKALNGGMDVNFDESKINFYTNVAAIRRIYTGHPTQFIKFETEGNYSRTIIGSNRNGGEVFNSATFAGVVVENTNNINTEDNVRIYGDNTLLRHAQGDVGWNINSVTQRIVPANINAESEIWSKHFVAPDKNSKPVRLDTAVAALWDIWNHIIYNNFEFNEALRTHIKARRDNWKFELNL
ncbi:TPA: gp58-like family protein, partial [Streptococcus suis]